MDRDALGNNGKQGRPCAIICHRTLSGAKTLLCCKQDCSIWNEEKNECSEKTYFKAYQAMLALQIKAQYLLEKLK